MPEDPPAENPDVNGENDENVENVDEDDDDDDVVLTPAPSRPASSSSRRMALNVKIRRNFSTCTTNVICDGCFEVIKMNVFKNQTLFTLL